MLPLNVVATLPTELEEQADLVWKELEVYLEAHGRRLQTVRLLDARRLWLDSIRQVRAKRESEQGFEASLRVLALALAQHAEFDAVIVPSLFVQQARMVGKTAKWSGVRRRIDVVGEDLDAGSIILQTSLSGTIQAASLHVVVLDAQGEAVHEGRGGLDLVQHIHMLGERSDSIFERGFVLESRPDPFDSRAHLREGISEAFDPFLRPLALEEE
jgi:hypothetical protein